MKTNKKHVANRLENADAVWISACEKVANRLPIKLMKNKGKEEFDLQTLFKKKEDVPNPTLAAVIVNKTVKKDRRLQIKSEIKKLGLEITHCIKKDGVRQYVLKTNMPVKKSDKESAVILKFDDEVAVVLHHCQKFLEHDWQSESFKDLFSTMSIMPSMYTASNVLTDVIGNIVYKGDSAADVINKIEKAVDDFKVFAVDIINKVPVESFKLEAALSNKTELDEKDTNKSETEEEDKMKTKQKGKDKAKEYKSVKELEAELEIAKKREADEAAKKVKKSEDEDESEDDADEDDSDEDDEEEGEGSDETESTEKSDKSKKKEDKQDDSVEKTLKSIAESVASLAQGQVQLATSVQELQKKADEKFGELGNAVESAQKLAKSAEKTVKSLTTAADNGDRKVVTTKSEDADWDDFPTDTGHFRMKD